MSPFIKLPYKLIYLQRLHFSFTCRHKQKMSCLCMRKMNTDFFLHCWKSFLYIIIVVQSRTLKTAQEAILWAPFSLELAAILLRSLSSMSHCLIYTEISPAPNAE